MPSRHHEDIPTKSEFAGRLNSSKIQTFFLFGKDRGTSLFYLAFCIYLISYLLYIIELDSFGIVPKLLLSQTGKGIAILLLGFKFLTQGNTKKTLSRLLIATPFIILSTFFSGDLNMLILLFFVAASPGIQFTKMAKYATTIEVTFFLVVVVLYLVGILPTAELEYRPDGTVRYSLGFAHPNACGLVLFSICLSYSLFRFRGFRPCDLCLYIPSMLLCWFVLDSRTSFVCIAIIALLSFLISREMSKRARKQVMLCFIICFVVFVLLSLLAMFFFNPDNPLFGLLNGLFSGRFYLMHFYFSSILPMPFGTNWDLIDIQTGSFIGFVCDNAYAHLILQSGYITGSGFLLLYLGTFVFYYKKRDLRPEILGLFLCAIFAFSESQAFHFAVNYSLIAFAVLFYSVDNYQALFRVSWKRCLKIPGDIRNHARMLRGKVRR